jgi:hypothetical protein
MTNLHDHDLDGDDTPSMANTDATADGIPATPSARTTTTDQPAATRPCRPRQTYASIMRVLSEHLRGKVWRCYRDLGGKRGRLNDQRRAILAEAIFQIENDLEHRQPTHPTVRTLRAIRNRYDDLGWNESRPTTTHQEHTDATDAA